MAWAWTESDELDVDVRPCSVETGVCSEQSAHFPTELVLRAEMSGWRIFWQQGREGYLQYSV